MAGWIPCSERMPLYYRIVIVFSPESGIELACWYRSRVWVSECDSTIKKVTHWMPLPPPPDAEQRNTSTQVYGLAGPSVG